MAEANKNIKGTIASLNTYHTDAYAIAVRNGYKGTEAEWVRSLVGKSAYEIAVLHGYEGTEEEWVAYIKGKSAYELSVQYGYKGTEAEWVAYVNANAEVCEQAKQDAVAAADRAEELLEEYITDVDTLIGGDG